MRLMTAAAYTCGISPMDKTNHVVAKFALILLLFAGSSVAVAQQEKKPLPSEDASTPHRTRLILKDGSYQLVMSYRVMGKMVRYVSAERAGQEEEVPIELVDFEATKRWEQKHTASADGQTPAPTIDPELLKEEADRAAL